MSAKVGIQTNDWNSDVSLDPALRGVRKSEFAHLVVVSFDARNNDNGE